MQRDPSLAERDVRVARLGEAALRLMAGTVGRSTLEQARRHIEASPDFYPWEAVVDELLVEPVDPSHLFQQGLVAQRDWIERGGAGPVAAPVPAVAVEPRPASPRPPAGRRGAPRSASFHFKTFVAILIVRGAFYGVMIVALVIAAILLEERYPAMNIYTLADDLVGWVKSLRGG